MGRQTRPPGWAAVSSATNPSEGADAISIDSEHSQVRNSRPPDVQTQLRDALNNVVKCSLILEPQVAESDQEHYRAQLRQLEQSGHEILSCLPNGSERRLPTSLGLRAPGPSASGARPVVSPPQGAPAGRILVVDDELANRVLISKRLQHQGFSVELAEDGEQAKQMMRGGRFDLVILDVMMPGTSGLEVLREVRSRLDATSLPIIMATARDRSEDVVEALHAGANDYVTKPLDFPMLLARINTQLGLKQATDKVRNLNQRLDSAQDRIAQLLEWSGVSGDTSGSDASEGVIKTVAREISDAVAGAEVVIWLFRAQELVNQTGGKLPPPTSKELRELKSSGRTYRDAAVLLAITSHSGTLIGALGIAAHGDLLGPAEDHLVTNLARHLSSILELNEMRRKLARTAEQRRATQREMVKRGVQVLHICPNCARCYPHTTASCEIDGAAVHPTARPFPYRVSQRYRLLRRVGEGGMGTIFLAHDERLDREVALKLVKSEHFHDQTMRKRFENEARAVARIEHPAVVKVFDTGEAEDGSLFMVMEWLTGTDLACVLEQQGPGSPQQVAEMLRQISGALSAAHAAKLVHRDIKPENIFLQSTEDGLQFKLLDFGVAKEMTSNLRLTETGGLIGTPLYMSPEQLTNQRIDARADVYSLAAVAYEALTGLQTVHAENLAEVVLALTTKQAPRLSAVFPDVPPELDEAFARGLARTLDSRPTDVVEWVSSFEARLEAMRLSSAWSFSGVLRKQPSREH